jgi:hypothetical protein
MTLNDIKQELVVILIDAVAIQVICIIVAG